MWLLRLWILATIKIVTRLFYTIDSKSISGPIPWSNVRLALLLNHTSLFEPIFSGILPWEVLYRIARNGTVPIAAETLKRPIAGWFYRLMVANVIPLTRKRDDSWDFFMTNLDPKALVLFMPEGRMKRPNGLDKHGNPMTVRGGIVDLLNAIGSGGMVVGYSGGLHHMQAPGQRYPRLFKRLSMNLEYLRIEDYLREFPSLDERARRRAIVANLEVRRDLHCK